MAPTVFRTHKVRFVIYSKDHDPPHVHAIKGDFEAEARIELNFVESFVEPRIHYGSVEIASK